MSGQETNDPRNDGYSGKSLLLMFVGGALAGAAVAYLAQAPNRARVRGLAIRAGEKVGHLPSAVRNASHAAKEAFAEAYQGKGNGEAVVSASKHKRRAEAREG